MPSPAPSGTSKKRRWPWIVGVVGLLVVALGAYGIWWFLKDDSPPPPSLEGALAGVSTTAASPASTAASTTAEGGSGDTTGAASGSSTAPDGVAGTWSVDTSLGDFSFQDATGTFVGFRLDEELQGIGKTQAVGRTPAVTGTITIYGTTLTATEITADLSKLTTNESRRDSRARGALDTSTFPDATFTLTSPVELGADVASGQPVTVQATGDLTIRDVTKSVTVDLQAQLNDDGTVIAVVGSIPVVFADYGVAVPKAPVVVSAADNGDIELQLLFTRS
jgi:polyisoprenoid-binding protein YceI